MLIKQIWRKFKKTNLGGCKVPPPRVDRVKSYKNSVKFHKECSILSQKDKMTKKESKKDFLHKILKDFVCISSNISFFSEIEAK